MGTQDIAVSQKVIKNAEKVEKGILKNKKYKYNLLQNYIFSVQIKLSTIK